MQFHDFDSIVEDPCCVEDKSNIQNPLTVHRGGFLGSCLDERSGGIDFGNMLSPNLDRNGRGARKGQEIAFLVTKDITKQYTSVCWQEGERWAEEFF